MLTNVSTVSETCSAATQATNSDISNVTSPGKATRGAADVPGPNATCSVTSKMARAREVFQTLLCNGNGTCHHQSSFLSSLIDSKSSRYRVASTSTAQEDTRRQQQRPLPHERLKRMRKKNLVRQVRLLSSYSWHSLRHCHVESSPSRIESMPPLVADRLVQLTKAAPMIRVVDITGRALKLHEEFRYLRSKPDDMENFVSYVDIDSHAVSVTQCCTSSNQPKS